MGSEEPELLEFRDAARRGGVDVTVIEALVGKGYLESVFAWVTFYTHGVPVLRSVTTVYKKAVIGLSSRWISVSEAADVVDMATPRGMYNRVLKNQVRYIRAPKGKFFSTRHQEGLEILIDKSSIKPYARPFR